MRADKTGVAAMGSKIGALIDLLLLSGAKAKNDFVFLGNYLGEINAYVRCVDTPARSISRVMSNLRAMDHRFSGGASDVDACAAQILFLDERNRPPQIGEPISEGVAALARADDDGVVLHWVAPGRRIGPQTLQRMQRQSTEIKEIMRKVICPLHRSV